MARPQPYLPAMSDRNQRKAAAKREREAALAEAARRASNRKRILWTAGGAATLCAAAALVVLLSGGGSRPTAQRASIPATQITDLKAAAKAAGGRFTSYRRDYGTGDHVTTKVHYPTNPPLNGPHYPDWAADGNYAGRTTPRTEMLVHALEHGRIEIQYRPGLPQAQIDQLVALYDEDPQHVLLYENETGMDCDVAVTAWGHGLLCDRFSDRVFDAIRAFKDQYRDQGPEYVA